MALNKSDQNLIQEIVALDGDCLSKNRCIKCPFRARCLPEFLNDFYPTQRQRAIMALDVLAYNSLMDDPKADIDLVQIIRNGSS